VLKEGRRCKKQRAMVEKQRVWFKRGSCGARKGGEE